MPNETIYDIRLRYLLDDKASKGIKHVGDEADKAAHHVGGLGDALGGIGAMVVGAFGVHEAAKALIGFNEEVQNAQIGLSAMLQGNLGGTWEQATAGAAGLYTEFQKFSTLTPVTTQQMMEFGNGVAVATFQAGGSIKDFTNLTEQGVVAAKALGQESGYAAREISEMLQGNVSNRMMFAKQLLGMAHMTTEEFRKLSAAKRMAVIEGVLNSPAMKNATTAFSESFAGVTSTLEDKLQILMGKIGLPLFKAITKEISGWNDYLEKNADVVDKIATDLSHGLVEGFHVVKDAISFLIEHKDTLLTLGKVWLALQAGNAIGGVLGSLGGGAGGIMGGLRSGAFSKGAGGVSGTLGMAAGAGVLGYQLGKSVDRNSPFYREVGDVTQKLGQLGSSIGLWSGDFSDERRAQADHQHELDARMSQMTDAVATAHSQIARFGGTFDTKVAANLMSEIVVMKDDLADLNYLRKAGRHDQGLNRGGMQLGEAGALGYTGDAALQKLFDEKQNAAYANPIAANAVLIGAMSTLNRTALEQLDSQKAQESIMELVQRTIASGALGVVPGMDKYMQANAIVRLNNPSLQGYGAGAGEKAKAANVHVTIQRIEVQSDDPDRMAFGLVEAFRDTVRNPSHAFDSLREG